MSPISTSQITIMTIGVENYQFFRSLQGPQRDVERFVDLLANSPATSLYQSSQVISLFNPDSNALRITINDYIINRSTQGDVLIFYFSGHGVPIGHSDFGFCTTDARIHDVTGSILPFTVIKFRDLIDSLRVMSVTPIIIVDACYSGMVGRSLYLSSSDAIDNMRREVASQNATNYALFCSCSDRQVSIGNRNGGYFSQTLFDILSEGFPTKKSGESMILIRNVYDEATRRLGALATDFVPQLFLGDTVPAIPLVKNIGFTPMQERFSPYMGRIVLALWNDGKERELSGNELLSLVGPGAYGNHSKLSYSIWGLLEDNPINHKRRLTKNGRLFARGEIAIPNKITYDSSVGDYVVSPDAIPVYINN